MADGPYAPIFPHLTSEISTGSALICPMLCCFLLPWSRAGGRKNKAREQDRGVKSEKEKHHLDRWV